MRAIAITPGKPGIRLVERPEPKLAQPDQVKLQVVRVGICGTDREEIIGGRAAAPAGATELVIGHEMLGRVVEVGASVGRVHVGDYAVFSVRRGCGVCANCNMQRADMCQTGRYTERGINGADGYQTEFAVDREIYITRVPPELESTGVLLEPLSIVEKAIAEALRMQRERDPEAQVTPSWISGRCCLVAGLGPVGLLAALVLRLRGAEVYGLDILDPASARPQWLQAIGGHYLKGPAVKYPAPMAFVLDASGFAALEFNLLDALAPNGIYALTGIPGGDKPLQLSSGASLLRQMVLSNQAMFGSVNAARGHFQMAADDLLQARHTWGNHVEGLITHHHTPQQFVAAEGALQPGVIKAVVEWQ
ncbi:MAG: alcohol dehydrogenase catalytic domain-containing protein [Terriglobales bacterium]